MTREGNFTRSSSDVMEEINIFQGMILLKSNIKLSLNNKNGNVTLYSYRHYIPLKNILCFIPWLFLENTNAA